MICQLNKMKINVEKMICNQNFNLQIMHSFCDSRGDICFLPDLIDL